MYERWIVDELGYEVCKVGNMTEEEIYAILDQHPEYHIQCILVRSMI